jgi:hypothetical protein
MMCSSFLTTEESPVSREAKEAMLALSLGDPEFRNRVMTPRIFDRCKRSSSTEKINWATAVSFAVVGVPDILSVREFVGGMMSQAELLWMERRPLIKD